MAIGDVVAQSGFTMPTFSGASNYVLLIAGALVVTAILGGIFYAAYLYFKFNQNIVMFEEIKGRVYPIGKDKGMLQRVGTAGDFWLVTKKIKKILPKGKIKMGRNTWWYFIREDGEWINFGLQSLNETMKLAKAYFVDEDMRLQRLGIQRNLTQRFVKQTFWDKHGIAITYAMFIIIVTVCLVVLFQKMEGNWAAAADTAQAIERMAQAVEGLRGTGVVPA